MLQTDMQRRLAAEFFGTFWLVFGGCGAAIFSAAFPQLGIGFVGVAFAFGLTVLSMAYAVGHISGGHFNPAVTLGLWSAGRCANKHVLPYILVQVLGAVVASAALLPDRLGQAGLGPGQLCRQWLRGAQPG
jgi:aquaporin Z